MTRGGGKKQATIVCTMQTHPWVLICHVLVKYVFEPAGGWKWIDEVPIGQTQLTQGLQILFLKYDGNWTEPDNLGFPAHCAIAYNSVYQDNECSDNNFPLCEVHGKWRRFADLFH
jgi:hypothetical protein